MKNEWFAYIKIAENESYIQSTGITFNEFYQGIEEKPESILLLKGFPDHAVYHRELGLEYIPSETVADFAKSNVYDFGDFCWVDFYDSKQLDALSDEQLAELLFFAHRAKPLKSFGFSDLGNQYAYYSHDDGWFVRVFMKDVKRYASVIAYKILTELKGRKKYISLLPDVILDQIYDLAKEGIVIDFENRSTTGVRIYTIGSVNDMDGIHSMLDKYRKSMQGLCLDYNSKSKAWSTY